MNTQSQKVLLISLDGATFDVLGPLMEQGYLPNLQRIQQSGTSSELASVLPPVTAPAWTSFMTGQNPNKHGIFDFIGFDEINYGSTLNNSRHIRSKTLWQLLSEKGKRVVVINLPYLYPPYPVNGILISGWDAPPNTTFTYPPHIAQEVLDIFPDYCDALDLSLWNYLPAESDIEFDSFIGRLIKSSIHTARLGAHFLSRENWDVGMVHFQQPDWIQHKLWGYIEHACADPSDQSKRIRQVRECYRILDQHVGSIFELTKSLSPLRIVLSDHGFGKSKGT